ncbi:MAG: YebC/PmpR family DNA-binding transcriptional regulator [Bacteroides sp.]
MGRAFEYRKATKLKRWGNMARVFTRVGKQIAIAVKAGGPDPENNSHLRAVIATAKRENMPKDNVERAIKNAMGKDTKDYKEMNYEGYGPYGIAIFIETATDNTTRTVANVRSVLNKFGGSLGTSGSLDFIFSWKSMFTIAKKEGVEMDDLILELIDCGVDEDYDEDGDEVVIYGDPKSFSLIQKYFEENNFEVKGAEFTRIPNDEKELTDEQRATIDKIIERLEDDEDVQNVYTNMKPILEEGE